MAKFCGKCGLKLDEKTGLCPVCDKEKIRKIIEIEEAKIQKEETKRQKSENKKKKSKKVFTAIIAVFGVIAVAALTVASVKFAVPVLKYNSAQKLMEEGSYCAAISKFEELNGFKDSENKIEECNYLEAISLMESEKYEEASAIFEILGNYNDSNEKKEECNYLYAVDLMKNGKYEEAIACFEELNGYKESAKYIGNCYVEIYGEGFFEIIKSIKEKEIGETVSFGTYEQDGNFDNGSEPIEWFVINKENGKVLLITRYGLANLPYHDNIVHDKDEDVTWETCTLRTWLNGEFIETAFDETEKRLLSEMDVKNDIDSYYGINGGNDTVDKVILLSTEEAEQYFWSDDERKCKATEYVGNPPNSNGTSLWRLRTPGINLSETAYVDSYGSIFYGNSSWGFGMVDTPLTVRPVICIDTARFDSAINPNNMEIEAEETDENELGIPDCFTTESENWAETYFDEMISKINYIGYKNVFNTTKVKSLFTKNTPLSLDDILLPGEIMSAYWYITGFEEKMGFLGKDYYSLEEIEISERLTEKDKEVLQSFFAEGDFAEKYETSVLKAAFNYFYGKNTIDIKAISNETNFYISEDGTSFYVKAFGIGGGMSNMYYRLEEVKYEGNEAVLYFNILLDDVFSGCVMDYTNGNILVESNNVNVQSFENKVAFETLCKENGLNYDDFGTAKLRIGKDGNNVYIIGWEGTAPGNW